MLNKNFKREVIFLKNKMCNMVETQIQMTQDHFPS